MKTTIVHYYARTHAGGRWHVTEGEDPVPARAICGTAIGPVKRRTGQELGDAELARNACKKCRPWIAGRSQFDPHWRR